MSEIGVRIATTRALARLSASELGRLAEMSTAVVGLIETRKNPKPSADTIQRIAEVLGTTSEFLLRGTGEQPTFESVNAAVALARARALPKGHEQDSEPEQEPASERNPTPGKGSAA